MPFRLAVIALIGATLLVLILVGVIALGERAVAPEPWRRARSPSGVGGAGGAMPAPRDRHSPELRR